MPEGERPQKPEVKNEQLENDLRRVNHLLNDYFYEPAEFVDRETRKQWEASNNPEDRERLEHYKMNMHRSNNINSATLLMEAAAMSHFAGTELEKKYDDLSEEIVKKVHDAGAVHGKPVPTEIVFQVRGTLEQLKADLEAKR